MMRPRAAAPCLLTQSVRPGSHVTVPGCIILMIRTYCLFAHKWQVVLVTHCPQIYIHDESIGFPTIYRLTSSFFALRKYFDM